MLQLRPQNSLRAFSLIEMVLVLAISGLMVGLMLKVNQGGAGSGASTAECYTSTKIQMTTIRRAIEVFANKNDRLPLPAARNEGVENVSYGREAAGANIDAADGVSFGALPFQTLGLSPSYGGDCWGNKLSYAVTTALTTNASSGGYLDMMVAGNITLKSNTVNVINTTTAYAVISHGEDALGAVKLNYSAANTGGTPDAAHQWCSGATLKSYNCLATSATLADAVFNDGKDAGANYYDDVIVAAGKPFLNRSNVYCWGVNSEGALGDGTTANWMYPSAVQAGVEFAKLFNNTSNGYCGLTAAGDAYCWGDNTSWALGGVTCNGCASSPSPTQVKQPTLVPGGFKFSTLLMIRVDTCGIVAAGGNGTAGEIRCWGQRSYNATTMLPNTGLASVYYGWPQTVTGPAATKTFTSLTAGTPNHVCAIETGTNTPYCWGRNNNALLGAGPSNGPGSPTAATVPVGMSSIQLASTSASFHQCGLGTNNKIYCWGNNTNGRIGQGHAGYGLGYASPPAVSIAGGGGSGATATARVLNGGIVQFDITAGGSGYTSPPDVSFTGSYSGTYASAVATVDSSGAISGIGINPQIQAATEIPGGRSWTSLATLDGTVCAIEMVTQDLYCWGRNGYGAVGNGVAGNTTSGYNYTGPANVTISGGGGTGATATATITGNSISAITLTAMGSGYLSATPAVFITDGGATGYGAYADASRGGPIGSFTISNPGYQLTPGVYSVPVTATGTTALVPTAAIGCQASVDATGVLTGIACSGYGDGYASATVDLSSIPKISGTGIAATANVVITANKVVSLSLTLNNADVWVPTLLNGGAVKFKSIDTASNFAFIGIATDNRLYAWGNNGGGANYSPLNTNAAVPTLVNAFIRNSGCGGAYTSKCNTSDSTGAGMAFSSITGRASAVLDMSGAVYMWNGNPGNGSSWNGGTVMYSYPASMCPTTPVSGVAPCNYQWSALVGNSNSNACAIKTP